MGVLGLTPFLQKQVVKRVPDRLKAFAGKTIVFDATLITQRLHFTQSPHPHRHVLGWYKIVKELEESGVRAICVFDGKQRNAAKAAENKRRRERRQLASVRSVLEDERLKRLAGLNTVLSDFNELEEEEKAVVLSNFYSSFTPTKRPQPADYPDEDLGRGVRDVEEEILDFLSRYELYWEPGFGLVQVEEVELPQEDDHISQDQPISYPTDATIPSNIEHYIRSMSDSLTSLYNNYIASLHTLSSLTTSTPAPETPSEDKEEEAIRTTEVVMSKTQYQLNQEEGKIWKKLRRSPSSESIRKEGNEPSSSSLEDVMTLTQKSRIISSSYTRASTIATTKTYRESRQIIRAMGVPCIETEGAIEAEALASSLVVHGEADFVASEDTDVLIYDAPLIRNITNRRGPLVIMSASDIRSRLQLSKPSFLDFALLLGTDFNQRIKNIGPFKAYKFIQSYGSIEKVIEAADVNAKEKYIPVGQSAETYLESVNRAREIFQTLPPIPDSNALEEAQKEAKRDDEKVEKIMKKFGLGRELILEGVEDWTGSTLGHQDLWNLDRDGTEMEGEVGGGQTSMDADTARVDDDEGPR